MPNGYNTSFDLSTGLVNLSGELTLSEKDDNILLIS